MISIEDFTLVKTETFDDVLIRVSVNGFFESLTQQILSALGRSDMSAVRWSALAGASQGVAGAPGVRNDENRTQRSLSLRER